MALSAVYAAGFQEAAGGVRGSRIDAALQAPDLLRPHRNGQMEGADLWSTPVHVAVQPPGNLPRSFRPGTLPIHLSDPAKRGRGICELDRMGRAHGDHGGARLAPGEAANGATRDVRSDVSGR